MYKNILVCINEKSGRENLIIAAAQFATKHEARLCGMFVSIHQGTSLPPFGLVAADRVLKSAERDKLLYQDAKEQFEKIAEQYSIDANWVSDSQNQPMLKAARYVDLVITSQLQEDVQSGDTNFSLLNSLILESGKPVLLVPIDWQASAPGKCIVLGWDLTRESTRAVSDAMPSLLLAEEVHVATVLPTKQKPAAEAEIIDYLKQRGVQSELHFLSKDKQNKNTASVIQNLGETLGADLYVVGGYGHSRFREVVLGGVTRHMIEKCSAPVLLSH